MDTVTRGWVGTIVVEYPEGLVTHTNVRCVKEFYLAHEPSDEDVLVFAMNVKRGQLRDAQGSKTPGPDPDVRSS